MEETAQVWDPLSPTEAQELFSGLSAPWWISGGWAIDLFRGSCVAKTVFGAMLSWTRVDIKAKSKDERPELTHFVRVLPP